VFTGLVEDVEVVVEVVALDGFATGITKVHRRVPLLLQIVRQRDGARALRWCWRLRRRDGLAKLLMIRGSQRIMKMCRRGINHLRLFSRELRWRIERAHGLNANLLFSRRRLYRKVLFCSKVRSRRLDAF
jgi:hypothetical protein